MMNAPSTSLNSRQCPRCAGLRYIVERVGTRAVAKACDCGAVCSICQGAGFVRTQRDGAFTMASGPQTYDVAAPCSCRVLPKRLARFNASGVPAVLAHARFDNYKPARGEQDKALQVAQRFAHEYSEAAGTRGFVLGGPVGSGKTHLLVATLLHLTLERGVATQYVEISFLYAQIRRGFSEGKSGGEIIGPLSEIPVLAIDELGKGRMSAFELETMDELIARRYNAGRTTLFATNYSLEPEKRGARRGSAGYLTTDDARQSARESEYLRDRTGDRIFSRLMEMSDFVQFPAETPDHRQTRQEMRRAKH